MLAVNSIAVSARLVTACTHLSVPRAERIGACANTFMQLHQGSLSPAGNGVNCASQASSDATQSFSVINDPACLMASIEESINATIKNILAMPEKAHNMDRAKLDSTFHMLANKQSEASQLVWQAVVEDLDKLIVKYNISASQEGACA